MGAGRAGLKSHTGRCPATGDRKEQEGASPPAKQRNPQRDSRARHLLALGNPGPKKYKSGAIQAENNLHGAISFYCRENKCFIPLYLKLKIRKMQFIQ